MKLLIVTQAVDRSDSDLGFFVRWIEEFSKRCESVIVVCLSKGEYTFPTHVEVIALGERGRALRALELCAISFGRRSEYDAVFAHMSPEFVVAAGWLWRLLGKRVGLWYVHKSVTFWLRVATLFAHRVFSASKESFRLLTRKLVITGHGIDTDFFMPGGAVRNTHLLSVGRLSKSKRHDLVIRAAALAGRELRVAGEGEERKNLESLARSLRARVVFLGGLSQEQLRDEYRKAAFLVHTSETGSLDKVVLEALATDTSVITTGDVFRNFPVHSVQATPEAIAHVFSVERENSDRVSIIRERHSLPRVIKRILSSYERY